jgi:hypothetical protein
LLLLDGGAGALPLLLLRAKQKASSPSSNLTSQSSLRLSAIHVWHRLECREKE